MTCTPGGDDSGVLWWLYVCLRDTTTKYHAGASSPRLLYRSENFTPVRNLATVWCKREMTTRFGKIGPRVDWNEWWLWITRVLYQRQVYFPIRRFEMTPSLCKQKVIQVWKWRRCEFCLLIVLEFIYLIWCFLFEKSNLAVERNNILNLECKDVCSELLENSSFFRTFYVSLILSNYRKCMGKCRFSKNLWRIFALHI